MASGVTYQIISPRGDTKALARYVNRCLRFSIGNDFPCYPLVLSIIILLYWSLLDTSFTLRLVSKQSRSSEYMCLYFVIRIFKRSDESTWFHYSAADDIIHLFTGCELNSSFIQCLTEIIHAEVWIEELFHSQPLNKCLIIPMSIHWENIYYNHIDIWWRVKCGNRQRYWRINNVECTFYQSYARKKWHRRVREIILTGNS